MYLVLYSLAWVTFNLLSVIFPDIAEFKTISGFFNIRDWIILYIINYEASKINDKLNEIKKFTGISFESLFRNELLKVPDEQFLSWINNYNKVNNCNLLMDDKTSEAFKQLVSERHKYGYSDKPLSYYTDQKVSKVINGEYKIKFKTISCDEFYLILSKNDIEKLSEKSGLGSYYNGFKANFEFRYKVTQDIKNSLAMIYIEDTETSKSHILSRDDDIKIFFDTIQAARIQLIK